MKSRLFLLGTFLFMSVMLFGCKSADSNDSSSTSSTDSTTYTGIAVDPYIEDAVFCEDKNNNGSCDADEQVSTASDASGLFSFASQVTVGSTIIVKTQGKHNGITYTLNITRRIDTTSDVENQVVSPLTTLATRDLTNEQIVAMLQGAGLTITTSDVTADPMSGIAALSGTVAEEQVVKIRSSIAVYALLRIINGSTTLSSLTGTALYSSAMTDGEPVHEVLETMATLVKSGLDPALIATIQSQLDRAPITLPAITAEDVARTAVAITDYIAAAGYTTCNATPGDATAKVNAALAEVQTITADGGNIEGWATKLGSYFYAARNEETLRPYASYMETLFPDAYYGLNCTSGIFVIDDTGTPICYSE